ncbi:MAG TPA: NAD(P)H-hydrate epimerase [Gaiellaceae bacterium]|nr:NAD(P)H-hydrate epimerase [Gaiellaceae bacterium]
MQHGEALAAAAGDAALAEAVASGAHEKLEPRLRALLAYALKLTRTPAAMTREDLDALREHRLDDRAIVDANQVVAYFNYVNRVADGLGVELEPWWPAEARRRRRYPRLDQLPAVVQDEVPWLSVEQMREVDRIAVEETGVLLEQMMENAGRSLAAVARLLLGGSIGGKRVLVLAGPGGNGGGGLVAARHLAAAGAAVSVALDRPAAELAPVPGRQHALARAAGVPVEHAEPVSDPELILDVLLGYGQAGPPRETTAALIEGTSGRRVLALDAPSGLELAAGSLHEPHVRAEATLTLALPKQGLRDAAAREAVGQLLLADISVPAAVYARLGLEFASPFARGPIVRLVS